MFNRNPLTRLLPIAAMAALMLTGCKETATETAEDVAKARSDATENVSEARQDLNKTINKAEEDVAEARHDYTERDTPARADLNEAKSDAMDDTAEANYDVAMAEAEGIENIASEKCGVLSGVEKNACLSAAEATFEAAKARAIAERDAALVAASRNQ